MLKATIAWRQEVRQLDRNHPKEKYFFLLILLWRKKKRSNPMRSPLMRSTLQLQLEISISVNSEIERGESSFTWGLEELKMSLVFEASTSDICRGWWKRFADPLFNLSFFGRERHLYWIWLLFSFIISPPLQKASRLCDTKHTAVEKMTWIVDFAHSKFQVSFLSPNFANY